MVTTIQISKELLKNLQKMKIHAKESYEELIWDLIEDRMELSEQTKRDLKQAEKEIREGKTVKWEDVKKELKINA